MTNPNDDGTYKNYRRLAAAILARALRDARPSPSVSARNRLSAEVFLQAPATAEFYRMVDIDMGWVLRLMRV